MGDGKMVAVVAASSGEALDRVRELHALGVRAVTLCSPGAVESAAYQASTLGLRLQLEVREGASKRGDWQEMQWTLLAHGVTKTSEGVPLEPVRERDTSAGALSLEERALLETLASCLEANRKAGLCSVNVQDPLTLARVLRKAAAL